MIRLSGIAAVIALTASAVVSIEARDHGPAVALDASILTAKANGVTQPALGAFGGRFAQNSTKSASEKEPPPPPPEPKPKNDPPKPDEPVTKPVRPDSKKDK